MFGKQSVGEISPGQLSRLEAVLLEDTAGEVGGLSDLGYTLPASLQCMRRRSRDRAGVGPARRAAVPWGR